MGLDVTYKGEQIATVGPMETKVLTTASKYCEDNVTLVSHENPVATDNDVIFIDYDGTIRYSYTAEEFLTLTELPPNPYHQGLTAKGWYSSLSHMKDVVAACGSFLTTQLYTTESGAVELDLNLFDQNHLNPSISMRVDAANTLSVEWGDGSSKEIISHSSGTRFDISHAYSAPGVYTIKLYSSDWIHFDNSNNLFNGDWYYSSGLLRLRLNGRFSLVGQVSFQNCINLESIAGHIDGSNYNFAKSFRYCRKLQAICINQWDGINSDSFTGCWSLKYMDFGGNAPSSLSINVLADCWCLKRLYLYKANGSSYISSSQVPRCYSLEILLLQSGIPSIPTSCFQNCQSLRKLKIPESVTSIAATAFQNMYNALEIVFTRSSPPSIANANAFGGLTSRCVIIVPADSLSDYLAATNYPNPASYKYLGFSTYEEDAELPETETTGSYNLTWYATKADAIAETNPITAGNGKEIYCRYTVIEAEG